MEQIFVNLKRFDIPPALGGVNRLCAPADWGRVIVSAVQEALRVWAGKAAFTFFFPEAHLAAARAALAPDSPVRLGCQGVSRLDTAPSGAFGAFTGARTANAMRALGCQSVLIGHCEERAEKAAALRTAKVDARTADETVNRLLNEEIKRAQDAGLHVLYCVGESQAQQAHWQETLCAQLETGLADVNPNNVTIAYEPIWSIGPGKTPADNAYIQKVARLIRQRTGGLDVVYGGGLKSENAASLAAIPEIRGGLIALTRFSGEIGFYPEEYLRIVELYMRARGLE